MEIKTLKELQDKFNVALESAPIKLNFINFEIEQILVYRNAKLEEETPFSTFNIDGLSMKHYQKTSGVFELNIDDRHRGLFKDAYEGFYSRGNFKKERAKYDTDESYKINQQVISQANELTKYYNWLKELDLKPKTTKNKSKLTLNQKVLALHYLGLDLKKYDRTKSSNVLSQIIGEDESNTRKSLNYINSVTKEEKVKNIQNLKKLIELFENEQFDKIKTKIKEDLEKVEVTD